jgi:hypothetical protein
MRHVRRAARGGVTCANCTASASKFQSVAMNGPGASPRAGQSEHAASRGSLSALLPPALVSRALELGSYLASRGARVLGSAEQLAITLLGFAVVTSRVRVGSPAPS